MFRTGAHEAGSRANQEECSARSTNAPRLGGGRERASARAAVPPVLLLLRSALTGTGVSLDDAMAPTSPSVHSGRVHRLRPVTLDRGTQEADVSAPVNP